MIHRNDLRGRRAPEWAQGALAKFGVNPYGEPNFRVIWRPSRTKIVGGFWIDNARFEYRRMLMYGKIRSGAWNAGNRVLKLPSRGQGRH